MNFEIWWLLGFPLFFILGWVAARFDIKDLISESRGLPNSYFKGLNFLLNEQPDKAIETLLEVAKSDPQTVELNFALGKLFRRRGEVERAIKMHQNLLNRPDLDRSQRLEALFELGRDFFKAGFLDRAENLFSKLVGTTYEKRGLGFLINIYEHEKDWTKAIKIARVLSNTHNISMEKQVANYFCELAKEEFKKKNIDKAKESLFQALEARNKCVRARIILGDIYYEENELPSAIESWKAIEKQNEVYLSLVGGRLLNAFKNLNKLDEGLNLLEKYLAKNPSFDLLVTVADGCLLYYGPDKSCEMVTREVQNNPNLLALNKLLELQLKCNLLVDYKDLVMVKKLVSEQVSNLSVYLCDECGFKASSFHWHCPACNRWETYSPKRLAERGGRI